MDCLRCIARLGEPFRNLCDDNTFFALGLGSHRLECVGGLNVHFNIGNVLAGVVGNTDIHWEVIIQVGHDLLRLRFDGDGIAAEQELLVVFVDREALV